MFSGNRSTRPDESAHLWQRRLPVPGGTISIMTEVTYKSSRTEAAYKSSNAPAAAIQGIKRTEGLHKDLHRGEAAERTRCSLEGTCTIFKPVLYNQRRARTQSENSLSCLEIARERSCRELQRQRLSGPQGSRQIRETAGQGRTNCKCWQSRHLPGS